MMRQAAVPMARLATMYSRSRIEKIWPRISRDNPIQPKMPISSAKPSGPGWKMRERMMSKKSSGMLPSVMMMALMMSSIQVVA